MNKLGIAIIGTGNIGFAHLDGFLKESDRCTIVALCNTHTDKCVKLLQDAGVSDMSNITITPDYRTLLDRDDIDIVSVCLPPVLHKDVCCDFLKHGKHVLCEKPIASSLEEADIMNAVSKESGKLLGVISNNRFQQDAMNVKILLESGVLGKVLLTRINSLSFRGSNYYDLAWRGKWSTDGGGCTYNQGIHQIDMLVWYLGLPESLTAVCSNLTHTNSELEDTTMAILKYPDSLAQLTISLNNMSEKQSFIFECENATVSVPWSVKCKKSKENGFPQDDSKAEAHFNKLFHELPKLKNFGHDGQISNFIDAVREKDTLMVTGEDGKKALELVDAIYKSSKEGKTVVLPISSDDTFYTRDGLIHAMPHYYEKTKNIDKVSGSISLGDMTNK